MYRSTHAGATATLYTSSLNSVIETFSICLVLRHPILFIFVQTTTASVFSSSDIYALDSDPAPPRPSVPGLADGAIDQGTALKRLSQCRRTRTTAALSSIQNVWIEFPQHVGFEDKSYCPYSRRCHALHHVPMSYDAHYVITPSPTLSLRRERRTAASFYHWRRRQLALSLLKSAHDSLVNEETDVWRLRQRFTWLMWYDIIKAVRPDVSGRRLGRKVKEDVRAFVATVESDENQAEVIVANISS
ncbi:hypothetical protein AYL99_11917 [Fonsecaea erecta]|uniref:Uncharacterized protein n=1 Tax=Fonsecaea erecta TaxID=1367422 RepID=A0A178Z464_9EURO|nr:hypothetical protein AYL99_11917 [Fonsecaea erecta]OAP53895.1 hypothetical protein AYL99_11917 [Fonsecaea erecta]